MRFFSTWTSRFAVLLAFIMLLAAFELTGSHAYPAGAYRVHVASPDDPHYDSARWRFLLVGYNARTPLSSLASWTLTKLEVEEMQSRALPLALGAGLVDEPEVERGLKAVNDATALVEDIVGDEITSSLNQVWTVGGSGGLVFALALLDSVTPGDLSGGLTVSATGVLTARGFNDAYIDPIRGLEFKLDAAEWVNADVIFVPFEGDTVPGTSLNSEYSIISSFDFEKLNGQEKKATLEAPGPLVLRVPTFSAAVRTLLDLGGACSCIGRLAR